MRRWPDKPKHKSRIEIIPMIDVMMFLLVFFVLISVNVIPALGVKTQLPNSTQAQSIKTPVKQVVVTLAKDSRILVDGRDVALDALAAAIRTRAAGSAEISVIVNSDRGAEVQALVDVMDELKANGLTRVALAARERR